MARCLLKIHAENLAGDVVSGATLQFFQFGTTTPITESLYKTATGTATYSPSEKVTNGRGGFEAYKLTGERVSVIASKSGEIVTTTEEIWWDPADLTGLLFSVRVRGAKGDGVVITDGAMGSGHLTLTSASYPFAPLLSRKTVVGLPITVVNPGLYVQADFGTSTNGSPTLGTSNNFGWRQAEVGKKVTVSKGGPGGTSLVTSVLAVADGATLTMAANAQNTATDQLNVVTIEPYQLRSTIAAYNDDGQITLAAPAPATLSGATVAWGSDDTDAIQETIDAARAAGGGTVEFTGGPGTTYLTGPLTLYDTVSLRGDGCTLRRRPGASGTLLSTPTSTTPLSNVKIDNLVINNDLADDHVMLVGDGSSRVKLQDVSFQDFRNSVVLAFEPIDGTTVDGSNSDIQVIHCSFTGVGVRNGGTLSIPNPINVRVEDCDFTLCGAIDLQQASGAASAVAHDIRFLNNRLDDVASTSLFLGAATSGQTSQDIYVQGNQWRNVGWLVRKGAIIIHEFAQSGATTRRVHILDNIVHGWGGQYLGGAIICGLSGAQIYDLTVKGNLLDGTYAPTPRANGTAETWGGQDIIGIAIDTAAGYVVEANHVRFTGGPGIGIINAAHGSVSTNLVEFACQINDSVYAGYSAFAGISFKLNDKNASVRGNIVRNTSAAGSTFAPWAGIGAGTDAAYVEHLILNANRCYDDRSGSAAQQFGIRAGLAGDPAIHQPWNWTIVGNDLSGNTVNGLLLPASAGATIDRNHLVASNPGYTGLAGPILYQGSVLGLNSAPFVIPNGTIPFAGLLHVAAITGDAMASNYYAIQRTNSSSPTQSFALAFAGPAQGGAAPPTVTSTTPSSGTFTVHNAMGIPVTILVELIPVLG